MSKSIAHWVAIALSGFACAMQPATDGRYDSFIGGGKADETNGLVENPAVARAVLRVANELPLADLRSKVGLADDAAKNIVAARPITTLKKLDAVDFVGLVAFEQLFVYARDHGYLGDAKGPDLAIDEQRLSRSLVVTKNASVPLSDVEAGCAGATSGRTLIHFDTKMQNFGPADLELGAVQCRSTRTDPFCSGVSCSTAPECCCDGDAKCSAGNASLGKLVEFSCSHGNASIGGIVEYRLRKINGAIVARGAPRPPCLSDVEEADSFDDCAADDALDCSDQGIHAGCASLHFSALPCAYVNATSVPAGRYVLEAVIDPDDDLAEADELNNVARASVTIGAPPPVLPLPAHRPLFLVRDGVGSRDEAQAYYDSLEPSGFVGDIYTLAQFQQDFIGARKLRTALYRNRIDLGFWREMRCTEVVDRGEGACYVTNWASPAAGSFGAPNLGTVGMRLDGDGRTQFFAFGPNGRLSPVAFLDDEGEKSVPRLCTPCHSGQYLGEGEDPDLGSVFRAFEPELLERRPGISQDQAEREWTALNEVVRGANRAVRSESEGGPFGVDGAKAAMEDLMAEMYPTPFPPVPLSDPTRTPGSWQAGSSSIDRERRRNVWTHAVAPYCMSCHRLSLFSFENYAVFETLRVESDGRALLRRYLDSDPGDPEREIFPFMPQSKLQWQNIHEDGRALDAIEAWLP